MDVPIRINSPPSQKTYDEATCLPDSIAAILPSPTMPVSDLLTLGTLPPLHDASADTLLPVEDCVLEVEACWTEEQVLGSPVPPGGWLHDVELEISRRLRSGMSVTSLRHPTVLTLYLPPWAINAWVTLRDAVNEREKWVKAVGWLRAQVAADGMDVGGVMGLLERLPWTTKLWILPEAASSPVGLLTELLSTQWLRERHIDAFTACLRSHVTVCGGEWWIGWVHDSIEVRSIKVKGTPKRSAGGPSDLIKRYRSILCKGGYKHLLLPMNVNGNHWILFYIDVGRREYMYGGSSPSGRGRYMHSLYVDAIQGTQCLVGQSQRLCV
jgi:hypothetical protein